MKCICTEYRIRFARIITQTNQDCNKIINIAKDGERDYLVPTEALSASAGLKAVMNNVGICLIAQVQMNVMGTIVFGTHFVSVILF
jgi:hypothetical protein